MLADYETHIPRGKDMANTSLNLGEHWEVFIKNEVASGHYGNASEVVRDALRNLEKHKTRLNALRSHLVKGAAQAARGEFASESLEDMLKDFRKSPDGKGVAPVLATMSNCALISTV